MLGIDRREPASGNASIRRAIRAIALGMRASRSRTRPASTAAARPSLTHEARLRSGTMSSRTMRIIIRDVAALVAHGGLTGEHLVEDAAQGPHVGPPVEDELALALLGRHVLRRAQRGPVRRQRGLDRARGAGVGVELGDAEVEDLRQDRAVLVALREEDVRAA